MTNRLTVKVNYILDAQNNEKFNLIFLTTKIFKNRTINTKVIEKNVKNTNMAKNLLKGSLTVIVVFFKRQEILSPFMFYS